MNDIDVNVKFWLKDIPYIWTKRLNPQEDWKQFGRIYILPRSITGTESELFKLPTENIIDCGDENVNAYFQLLKYSKSMIKIPSTSQVYMNGYKLNLPLVF